VRRAPSINSLIFGGIAAKIIRRVFWASRRIVGAASLAGVAAVCYMINMNKGVCGVARVRRGAAAVDRAESAGVWL